MGSLVPRCHLGELTVLVFRCSCLTGPRSAQASPTRLGEGIPRSRCIQMICGRRHPGITRRGGCRAAAAASGRSDESQFLGAAYCFTPAGRSELPEDALEVSLDGVHGEVHRGGDFFGAEH